MRLHTILLLTLPLLSFAQAPPALPPPEVDLALRARATMFFQYESEGNFRKAYDLVAEDSKDYYFNAPKQKTLSFAIDDIQYTGNFSMATVKATRKQPVTLTGQQVEIPEVLTSRWKLEKGEWVWYHDASKDVMTTILGVIPTGAVPAATADPANPSPIPKDLSLEAAKAAAAKISPKAAIDKKSVTFTLGKEATEEVTFSNSNPGQVRVYVSPRNGGKSITVEPHDFFINPQAEQPVKISYKPLEEDPLRRTAVEFTIEPFGSVYVLPVRFVREGSTPKQ